MIGGTINPIFAGLALQFWVVVVAFAAAPVFAQDPIPPKPAAFLESFCLDCHDADAEKGGVNLDFVEIAWSDHEVLDHWERVLRAIDSGEMPPSDEKNQPSDEERAAMAAWLDGTLTKHSPTGGTVVRRLNAEEYRNTVRRLFGMPDFQLPAGFPPDNEGHGFDNVGESLILSPPLMEMYANAAAIVADEIFPPARPAVESETVTVKPDEMEISFSSGAIRDGAMRLVQKTDSVLRSCTSPRKFEAKASGVYEITIEVSAFEPPDQQLLEFQVLAKSRDGNVNALVPELRVLKEIELSNREAKPFTFEAELYQGETVFLYYANAPLDSDVNDKDKAAFEALMKAKFREDQRLHAAWLTVKHGTGIRGRVGWERVVKLMTDEDLDTSKAVIDSPQHEALMKTMLRTPVTYVETVAYQHFETGPAIDVHGLTITGPTKLVEDETQLRRKQIQAEFLGERGEKTDDEYLRDIFTRYLTKAHRRPVEAETVEKYCALVRAHVAEGRTFEEGLHLGIRTALISPQFLYRSTTPGELDDYDLASRLSYFLTSAPPDNGLLNLAAAGRLSEPGQLQAQAERLIRTGKATAFVKSFTGQWLDTRLIPDIMPDQRLKFSGSNKTAARQEVEKFFEEMLLKNHVMTDFIDPDFTWTSEFMAKKIYGLNKGVKRTRNRLQRVSIERGGRYGGILGQSGIFLATANGVDTQPVVRGVWVLENVLGSPPPPPPEAVPAITPDTTNAKTVRELLQAHANDVNCAACHKKIDPIGFALENFDAVGRWRDHYPIYTVNDEGETLETPGLKIDPSGQLPDGTPINDIVDLKMWIVANIDQFSGCLGEKILTYATGRPLSYAERKEVAQLVAENSANENRFRNLVRLLVESEIFRTK